MTRVERERDAAVAKMRGMLETLDMPESGKQQRTPKLQGGDLADA